MDHGRRPGHASGARNVGGVGRLLRALAADAGRSRSHRRHAAERPALLRAEECQAGAARRAPARHQGRIGARRRRPAGPGAFRRAHAVRGHAELPAAGDQRVPGDARRRHRTGCERADELRRHAVPAARADRRAGRPQPRDARARGLGPGRDVRSRGDRAAARHRALGVAHAPRRRRADDGQAAAGAAGGIALRRSIPDRQARDHRARAARAAAPLLSRLVSPGSDGRHRRRRRRPRGGRDDDQEPLLVADLAFETSPAGLRRAGAPGYALRHRHRQGNADDSGRDQRSASGPEPGLGGRLSRHHHSISCSAASSTPGSTSWASARTRRSSGRRPIATCSRCRGRKTRR